MIKIYLVYSPLLPIDKKELNVCDYYAVDYRVKIDSDNISQIQGFQGQLTANVMKDNELVTDMPISWSTSDNKTVSIDSNGIYRLIGNKGSKAEIKAYLTDNENIYDTITINIVDDYLPEKKPHQENLNHSHDKDKNNHQNARHQYRNDEQCQPLHD